MAGGPGNSPIRAIGLGLTVAAVAWLGYAVPHWFPAPMQVERQSSPLAAPGSQQVVSPVLPTAPSRAATPSASSVSAIAARPVPVSTARLALLVTRTNGPSMTASPAVRSAASSIATAAPPMSPSSSPTPALTPSASVSPSASVRPTSTLGPSPTLAPPATVSGTVASGLPLLDVLPCASPSVTSHLWLVRPIPAEANDWVSTYYPYGSTAGGEYLIHHGVDIGNPEGTPVRAAGDGTVLYAGDDKETVFGPYPDFYGQLVVLHLDGEYLGQRVFTLYGHLSAISVEEGQRVGVGEKLGEVGATGIAMGPHLHFEVRVTDPYGYGATRNPELWIGPHPGRGLVAGQVFDAAGQPVAEARVVLYPAEAPGHSQREGWTYASRGPNPDEELLENLVWGDVPAGTWTVVAYLQDQRLRQSVAVRAGETSWVCLHSAGSGTQAPPGDGVGQ
jgi:murein DD-endopeptidase MepM/ murein hydrolase activator NlpD